MRGLFIIGDICRVKGTQDRRGISYLVRGQVDQGPFRGLSDRVDLRPDWLATRSQCLVPVVLLQAAQAQ